MARWQNRCFVLVLALATLAWSRPAAGQEGKIARQGTFEGHWEAGGTFQLIESESGSIQLYRLHGPAKVRTQGGLAREFDSRCLGVSDNETGGVARCSWTDGAGERIFIELSGEIVGPTGTLREAVGAVVGGTGRYRGMTGGFRLDWLFLESTFEPGKITGRTIKFEGSWKVP